MTQTTAFMTSSDEGSAVPIEGVFVSLDLETDLAYVVCESSTGLRWKQLPREDAELLASLGARAEVRLGSKVLRIGLTSTTRRARSPSDAPFEEEGCP